MSACVAYVHAIHLCSGPGCSSIGGGLFSELGPYYPSADGENLILNDQRWNRVANMIFLDSPAFVGWSYSEDKDDRRVGDKRTTEVRPALRLSSGKRDNHRFFLTT